MRKNDKNNFVTLFPECRNEHLIKDVGMIPYFLEKQYNYNSSIVSYANEELPYINNKVLDLNITYLNKITGCALFDALIFLLKNSRKISVLQLYHITSLRNYIWILFYKVLNRNGKVYIKMDAGNGIFREFNYHKKGLKGYIKRFILKLCSLISIENKELAEKLSKDWGIKIEYISNGFFDNGEKIKCNYNNKDNIICTVGRIGTYQKNTELLLDTFATVYEKNHDFKLVIVGPIESNFIDYIDNFYKKNSQLKEAITFCGEISNRNELDKIYKRSKIFFMTSRYEAAAIVYYEALSHGCYIVSTNVDSVDYVTNKGEFGSISFADDKKELAELLILAMSMKKEVAEKLCEKANEYAYREMYWPEICKKINGYLN